MQKCAGQQLTAISSQMEAHELSKLLHDAQQLIMQVHQSPSVSTSMTAETLSTVLSYSPSLAQSGITSCSETTYPPPALAAAWPQVNYVGSSPVQPVAHPPEGSPSTPSMEEGVSTPCFGGSIYGGTRAAAVSAVASSPVAASASSLSSSYLSGNGDSLELFIPALVEQDLIRYAQSCTLQTVCERVCPKTAGRSAEIAGKSSRSNTGQLNPASGSAAFSAPSSSNFGKQSFCRSSSPKQVAGDSAPSAPVTPELPMPRASSISSSLNHAQGESQPSKGRLREKYAANSSEVQSSMVPADWQAHQGASGSCSIGSPRADSGREAHTVAYKLEKHSGVRIELQ